MISNQAILCSHGHMTPIHCNRRSSILRSKELVEIGSCWPRILILSDDEDDESVQIKEHRKRRRTSNTFTGFQSIDNPIRRNSNSSIMNRDSKKKKKKNKTPVKITTRSKSKQQHQMLRQLIAKNTPPHRRVVSSPILSPPIPFSSAVSTTTPTAIADQNTSPWNCNPLLCTTTRKIQKTSSFTGRPIDIDISQQLLHVPLLLHDDNQSVGSSTSSVAASSSSSRSGLLPCPRRRRHRTPLKAVITSSQPKR